MDGVTDRRAHDKNDVSQRSSDRNVAIANA
jgi:hypothetical protein